MSSCENLKCQFCELKFSSTYKIIPHTFFGHKKKISKMVSKQGEIRILCPCAPAGCPFVQSQLVAKSASQEETFRLLARSLLGVEEHVNTLHTGEARLTSCPYCALVLDNIIYWEHLQEHMANNSGGGGGTGDSPVKTEGAGGTAATVPVGVSSGGDSLQSKPLSLVTEHSEQASSIVEETKMGLHGIKEVANELQPEVNGPLSADDENKVPGEDSVIAAVASTACLAMADGSSKVTGVDQIQTSLEKTTTEIPNADVTAHREEVDAKEPLSNLERSSAVSPSLDSRRSSKNRPRTPTEPPVDLYSSTETWKKGRDEIDRAVSPLPGTPKAPEELAADTIPFKVIFCLRFNIIIRSQSNARHF